MQNTIQNALNTWRKLDSDSPRLDVECLLMHVLSCDQSYLRTWPEKLLTENQQKLFNELFERRVLGEPIAHICGKRAFWTLNLNVSQHTLIPRPDTELLVEKILELSLTSNAAILDLGTGTGAIALALASERSNWKVLATDLIPDAVLLARQNAADHHLANVEIIHSDWFQQIPEQLFDLIVSNPPYIDPDDKHLKQGDVRFEPLTALISENHGLADIEHILREAKSYLKDGAFLVFEHGYDQKDSVATLALQYGYSDIECYKDYGAQDRMTMMRWYKGSIPISSGS